MNYPRDKKMYWEVFNEHIIEPDGEHAFIYRRPGTGIYRCYLYFKHGHIIIFGDVGPFVFKIDDPDSFEWASVGLESESYVMSKLRGLARSYDGNATFEHLKAHLTEDKDAEGLRSLEESKDDFENEQDAYRIAQELGFDYDSIVCTWDANYDAQWAYWILRTFMDKVKAPAKE
jgi:hypothetical protein